MEPLEKLGSSLEYAWGVVSHLNGVRNSKELRDVYQEVRRNNCCTASDSSSSYFFHRKNLNSLDCVHLQLDHNASHTCNHNAL